MTFRAWQTLVVALLFAVLTGAASMAYSNRAAAALERKWCDLLSTFDDAYRETPPQTPTGKKIADRLRELRGQRFNCP
ncbi:hypothetical protein F8271_07740 [Micromonospora sp. ALFpr18c]|uniref:hypothetical protein n=1 Tax=Micromonospora sp. NPDC050695 TaxID=3154938 RepID=UPI00124B4D95|nr:hypothetical protein F8271_07740 [Micromonospora sp. ALFpr18c]